MRLLVLTSCTGAKAVAHAAALRPDDFRKGPDHVARRERELADSLTPAEDLYTGQQHLRLLRGVRVLRGAPGRNGSGTPAVDVFVLSAGYGVVPGNRKLAPYECTFTGMGANALREWASALRIPESVRRVLSREYDLALVLLGDTYLAACDLGPDLRTGGPVLVLCSPAAARRLPAVGGLRAVTLSKAEAKRFRCGLVGLKGEVSGRLLELLARDVSALARVTAPGADVLALLDGHAANGRQSGGAARPNRAVDRVIAIPEAWWRRSQQARLRYFIPDWDDLVDPDYDFLRDRHSAGRGHWTNHVYAHQLFPEPAYDGILVSRLVAEKSREKRERINALGVHRFLRVPGRFPVMGDCGAFGYIQSDLPPYQTGEILEYYTRLGFTYGVSIDHLIVASTDDQRQRRYELTVQNAEDFLKEHRRRGLAWEPVGAVQGWDPASYAAAARRYAKMGYRYIALGGLVRSKTPEILRIVQAVREVIPEDIRLHLFGLARFGAIRRFVELGVTSIDSSSVLRKAWLGSDDNFLTEGGWYSAIRVPQSAGCFRAQRLVAAGERTERQLRRLESECLQGLRAHAALRRPPTRALLNRLTEYDTLLAGERRGTRERIGRTLEDRPWESCGCAVCTRWGVEVAIFRGNNRNRRRGFHNTHVFYHLLGRLLAGQRVDWIDEDRSDREDQPMLFPADAGS